MNYFNSLSLFIVKMIIYILQFFLKIQKDTIFQEAIIMLEKITRRDFIKKAGVITGLALNGIHNISAMDDTNMENESMPKRILGRTGVEVSILGLGIGPLGISRREQIEFDRLVNLCIDLGISYIDNAPVYGDGEEKLGSVMRQRRNEVFLVTKVEEQDKNGSLRQIKESLMKMQTDYIDAVHLHDFGGLNIEFVLGEDGALAGLKEAKKQGLIRFIGISGHQQPMKFLKALETDEIDLVMPVLNFADKHTYNFEEKVLPVAIEHKSGIVAMKVLGGAVGMQYEKPMPSLMPEEYYDFAIRYALGLHGVSTIVVGLKNENEIKQAVKAVKAYKPLSDDEKAIIEKAGKELSEKWGEHFGSV
ncbi:TPA: aldo/keto reductase [bacterium]|nr:aldo/keto reductase [bacterium]